MTATWFFSSWPKFKHQFKVTYITPRKVTKNHLKWVTNWRTWYGYPYFFGNATFKKIHCRIVPWQGSSFLDLWKLSESRFSNESWLRSTTPIWLESTWTSMCCEAEDFSQQIMPGLASGNAGFNGKAMRINIYRLVDFPLPLHQQKNAPKKCDHLGIGRRRVKCPWGELSQPIPGVAIDGHYITVR